MTGQLNVLYNKCKSLCRMKMANDMNVITHPTDNI